MRWRIDDGITASRWHLAATRRAMRIVSGADGRTGVGSANKVAPLPSAKRCIVANREAPAWASHQLHLCCQSNNTRRA